MCHALRMMVQLLADEERASEEARAARRAAMFPGITLVPISSGSGRGVRSGLLAMSLLALAHRDDVALRRCRRSS